MTELVDNDIQHTDSVKVMKIYSNQILKSFPALQKRNCPGDMYLVLNLKEFMLTLGFAAVFVLKPRHVD